MRGMSGFGHHPGMRQLPRPGATGGSLEFVSVPGLPGRRSRAGSGHWGAECPCVRRSGREDCRTVLCDGTGIGGADDIALRMYRAAFSGANLPGASQRRDRRRPAAPRYGRCKVPLSAFSRQHPWRPVQGRLQGGGVSAATPCRYGAYSVVTTTKLAKLGSDDAARRYLYNPETRVVCGFLQPGAEEPKSAGKCQKGEKAVFFALRQKSCTPMFDLVRKAESDALLAGQGSISSAVTLRH